MRVAPIGSFFYNDSDQLIRAACDQARITHQDSRSQAWAVAIVGAVAIAVQVEAIHPDAFLDQLCVWVESVDPSMAQYLIQLKDWLGLPVNESLAKIAPLGNPPESLDDWEGITPWIVPSILWPLYAFLSSPANYWETICTAIAGGGDTDTTVAMAGAISGAFLGIDAIPPDIAQKLTDLGKWGYGPMLSLADLAFHLAQVRRIREEEKMQTRWALEVG